MHGPSAPDYVDPDKVARKLKQLEPAKPVDPWSIWLPQLAMGNFGSDGAGAKSTDSTQPESQPPLDNNYADTPAAGTGLEAPYAPLLAAPPHSVDIVYGGFDFGLPSVQVAPAAVPAHQIAVTTAVSVPEPGAISLLIMGTAVVGTRRRRRPALAN